MILKLHTYFIYLSQEIDLIMLLHGALLAPFILEEQITPGELTVHLRANSPLAHRTNLSTASPVSP